MHKVEVTFPDTVPPMVQAEALMSFERHLRVLSGADIRVFKAKMKDDSKLRMAMTPEERAKV